MGSAGTLPGRRAGGTPGRSRPQSHASRGKPAATRSALGRSGAPDAGGGGRPRGGGSELRSRDRAPRRLPPGTRPRPPGPGDRRAHGVARSGRRGPGARRRRRRPDLRTLPGSAPHDGHLPTAGPRPPRALGRDRGDQGGDAGPPAPGRPGDSGGPRETRARDRARRSQCGGRRGSGGRWRSGPIGVPPEPDGVVFTTLRTSRNDTRWCTTRRRSCTSRSSTPRSCRWRPTPEPGRCRPLRGTMPGPSRTPPCFPLRPSDTTPSSTRS